MQNQKPLNELTDKELKDKYEAGKLWVSQQMQAIGTDKNTLGEPYNNAMFLGGLKKLEEIETEMMERGLIL